MTEERGAGAGERSLHELLGDLQVVSQDALSAARDREVARLNSLIKQRQELFEVFFDVARSQGRDPYGGGLEEGWQRIFDFNLQIAGALLTTMAQVRKKLRRLYARRAARSAYQGRPSEATQGASTLNVRR